MRANTNEMMATRINGIPCYISVDYYFNQASTNSRDSSDDYYGYTDFDFTVYDRKGWPALWLEKKLTSDDRARITREFQQYRVENV
jgi:hypothetical protein